MKFEDFGSESKSYPMRSVNPTQLGNNASSSSKLRGIWAPCLTPIKDNYTIDQLRLKDHIDWLLSNGCSGIVLFGTTGEAASFSAAERMTALEKLIASGVSPRNLIIGNGFSAITDTVAVTRHAMELGCESVLMVPPFYFKDLSLEGISTSFRYVLDEVNSSKLRVVLYHYPKMSAVPITHALIDKLIESHGELIAGLKDSSGDWQSVEGFIRAYPNLSIFPGSDMLLLKGLKIGAVGTITATADINPAGIRKVYDLWSVAKNAEDAQSKAEQIRQIVFRYPLAAALKSVHSAFRSDLDWNRVRPPLVVLSDYQRLKLIEALTQVDFQLNV